jgi:hypothetical protein
LIGLSVADDFQLFHTMLLNGRRLRAWPISSLVVVSGIAFSPTFPKPSLTAGIDPA